MIEHGANDFDLALEGAAWGGHIAIVRFLIDEHGANDFNGALSRTARFVHLEVVSFLELCLIDGFEEFRGNPLAFIGNNLDLIQEHPDIFVLWSIILHKPAILDFLLRQCPEAANAVYATEELGPLMALMLAASCGLVDMVERLVRAGADITVRNSQGENAAALAERFGHKDIAMMLSNLPLAPMFKFTAAKFV